MAQVKFQRGTAEQLTKITKRNPDTLYFVTDDGVLYLGDKRFSDVLVVSTAPELQDCQANRIYISGDKLYFRGSKKTEGDTEAFEDAVICLDAGDIANELNDIADKIEDIKNLIGEIPEEAEVDSVVEYIDKKVEDLEATVEGDLEELETKLQADIDKKVETITAADDSIDVNTTTANGDVSVALKVNLADAQDGVDNAITLVDDGGLYAPAQDTYELTKADESNDYAAVYNLIKKTGGKGNGSVVGTINLPKDMVLESGSLKIKSASDGVTVDGLEDGDPYLDLVIANAEKSHIYVPVKNLVDIYTAGAGISVDENVISVQLDDASTNGLELTDEGLALKLATQSDPGALSAADKTAIDNMPVEYMKVAYELKEKLPHDVRYDDGEVRIFFPTGSAFQEQAVGEGGDAGRYYSDFYAYAPENAKSFKEYLDSKVTTMPNDPELAPVEKFGDHNTSGVDKYGRKYTNVYLPVASKQDDGWNYFGKTSTLAHYVGWYYMVEWYSDEEGKNLISSDIIRINLSNETTHSNPLPYYMGEYSKTSELTWGEFTGE